MGANKNSLCIKNIRAQNTHDILTELIEVVHTTLQYEWN